VTTRADLAAALAAARAPQSCRHCGRLFIGSAFGVHRDDGECLPGDACGQLEQRDGVWVMVGSPRL
jgi:hypothetical protein